LFTSFSFNDVPVNLLTGAGYDPNTDTAELKVCPVRVVPAEGPETVDDSGAGRQDTAAD
jgi:hypothetical protein